MYFAIRKGKECYFCFCCARLWIWSSWSVQWKQELARLILAGEDQPTSGWTRSLSRTATGIARLREVSLPKACGKTPIANYLGEIINYVSEFNLISREKVHADNFFLSRVVKIWWIRAHAEKREQVTNQNIGRDARNVKRQKNTTSMGIARIARRFLLILSARHALAWFDLCSAPAGLSYITWVLANVWMCFYPEGFWSKYVDGRSHRTNLGCLK